MVNAISTFRLPSKILFGRGALEKLPEIVASYSAARVLVVTTEDLLRIGHAGKLIRSLRDSGIETTVYDKVLAEPVLDTPTEGARLVKDKACELVIGMGGGSAIDCAKAIALMGSGSGTSLNLRDYIDTPVMFRGLPTIMIPTTAGTGSEVTSVAIFTDTEKNIKVSLVSPDIIPSVAIVDPDLTVSMPGRLTAYTGIDALCHAIEAYVSLGASPLTDPFAEKSMSLISRNLRECVCNGSNAVARESLSLGSLMAGIAFANAGVGAAHALAYPIGGKYHHPHGLLVGFLLPHVMRASLAYSMEKYAMIARLLGASISGLSVKACGEQAVDAVSSLCEDIGIPRKLGELGVKEYEIPEMAMQASQIQRLMKNNPKSLSVTDIENIFYGAM
jgi:alcohol dehydrogenase class IV